MAFDLSQLFSLLGSPAPGQMVMPPVGSPAEQMPQFNGPLAQQATQPPVQTNLAPIPQVTSAPLGSADQPSQNSGAVATQNLGPQTSASQPGAFGGILDGIRSFTGSDRGRALGDFFTGLAMGSTPQQSLGYGAQLTAAGRATRQDKEKQQAQANQTVQYLVKRGVSPTDAALLASNPTALSGYLKETLAPKDNSTSDIKNYQYAVQNGFKGSFTDYKKSGEGGTKYGLQPIFGTDASGNQVLGTLGNDGSFKAIDTGGVKIQSGVEKIDLGTHYQLRDKRTGQVIGVEPKDLQGAAAQTAQGKVQGEASAALPASLQTAKMISGQIDDLKSDPYLPQMLGPLDSRLPNISTDSARVQGKMNQLQGGAFLQARQMLKGGGAITDYEGAKAEAAIARLGAAQSVTDYNKALDDFNEAVQAGARKLAEVAGKTVPAQAAGAPTTQGGPAKIGSPDEYSALPSGAQFVAPDGSIRRKP